MGHTPEAMSETLAPGDPRLQLSAAAAALAPIPSNVPLPCGLAACAPFEAGCIQPAEQTVTLAQQNCSYRIGERLLTEHARGLGAETAGLRAQVALGELIVQRLSIDGETGILTYNTQKLLFERLIETGLLGKMRSQGYYMEMLVLDLDKLKTHNALGDHAGGDRAIKKAVDCLLPLYRRKTDVVAAGILQYEREAREALDNGRDFRQLGRFERGDEVIGIGFNAPNQGIHDARHPIRSLDLRAQAITRALKGARVTYPLCADQQQTAATPHMELDYTINSQGQVNASVSGTFALAVARMPVTVKDFRELFEDINNAMNNLKRQRTAIVTQGVTLNLLPIVA